VYDFAESMIIGGGEDHCFGPDPADDEAAAEQAVARAARRERETKRCTI